MKLSIALGGLLSVGLANALATSKQVADCLGGKNVPVKFTNSPGYDALAEPFNLRLAYKPYVIVLPQTAQHVQDAVSCAAQCGLKVNRSMLPM